METFLLFLFTFVVISAAPHAIQRVVLAEIIQNMKELNNSLKTEILVPNVITPEQCTLKNFCKAGDVLSAYKAEMLGLKEKDWLLPRKLVAYTEDVNCKDQASEDRINFRQLLDNIQQCAQKEYAKPQP